MTYLGSLALLVPQCLSFIDAYSRKPFDGVERRRTLRAVTLRFGLSDDRELSYFLTKPAAPCRCQIGPATSCDTPISLGRASQLHPLRQESPLCALHFRILQALSPLRSKVALFHVGNTHLHSVGEINVTLLGRPPSLASDQSICSQYHDK